MILEQHYLDCLSQASYVVADPVSRRAVVVDPRRDVDVYLESARRHGLRIELIVLTHLHADFVPGDMELAAATGAAVAMSAEAPVRFDVRRLHDGERIPLGDAADAVELEVLATPGHTPDSLCLALRRHRTDRHPEAVLTGDTLLLGSVGRPDLGPDPDGAHRRAQDLHRSLHRRLLPLPDDVVVLPGHGPGSACGAQLSAATRSTLGEQRRTNPALLAAGPEEFARLVLGALSPPPDHFAETAALNTRGHALLRDTALDVLEPDEVAGARRSGALLLDVRPADEFAQGHLPGSVGVALAGRFAETAAAVRAPGQPVVLIGSAAQTAEARVRLARLGIDEVLGATQPREVDRFDRLGPAGAGALLAADPEVQVVDVRSPAEHAGGALPGAVNLPLPQLRRRSGGLDRQRRVLVHCAGGYRSLAAASMLKATGFADVVDLEGGWAAWTQEGAT